MKSSQLLGSRNGRRVSSGVSNVSETRAEELGPVWRFSPLQRAGLWSRKSTIFDDDRAKQFSDKIIESTRATKFRATPKRFRVLRELSTRVLTFMLGGRKQWTD